MPPSVDLPIVEPPAGRGEPGLDAKPPRLDPHESTQMRAAAFRATRLYPGPVGELISKELLSWLEFGFRFGSRKLISQLVHHVMTAPLPPPDPGGTP